MPLGINLALLIGPTVPLPAPPNLVGSIRSIGVTNTDEGRDGFQITFSSGRGGTAQDLFDYPLLSSPLLALFNRVIIMIALGAILKVLIDGVIIHIQLNPSNEPGQSTIIGTGEDTNLAASLKRKSSQIGTGHT